MEKKKLLLVAVSVGVFLVIVIGASILVFSPAKPAGYQTTAAARPISAGYQPASVDPTDMVRNAEGYQGLQVPPAATAFNENNIFINGETPDQNITFDQGNGETTKTQLVINVARPTTAAVPDAPPLPVQPATVQTSSGTSAAVKQTTPAATKPAAVVQASVKTAAPTSTAMAAQGKVYDVYWVQTGSFSAKVRADGVKENLASKGIASVIENRDVNGATYYRVRVGPYTSSNEADYWLALIKSIEGFEDSQIWKSPVRL
jgi:DedD protein